MQTRGEMRPGTLLFFSEPRKGDRDTVCSALPTDSIAAMGLGDANFNVTALVDGTSGSGTFGDVVERYVYDPYGNLTIYEPDWSDTRAASSYDWTVLFAGYWRDTETGLYHVRHRMYHVRLGLWLTRDPEGYVDGMSLYEYVQCGPLIGTDPQGLEAWISDYFKQACGNNYEAAAKRAGNALADGGVAGWVGFADGLVEAGVHGVVGGFANFIDIGARQDRVAADFDAEFARRSDDHPTAPAAATAIESVTAAILKNFPITEGIWGGVEGVYGERLGGVSHGQAFENWGERGAAISTGVASVTGTAAAILKAAGVNPKLKVPGLGKKGSSPASTGTRYVGPDEARVIKETGRVPNTTRAGEPKSVFYTPEDAVDSAAHAQANYNLPTKPSHAVTVDTSSAVPDYAGNVQGGAGIEATTTTKMPAVQIKRLNP